MKKVFFFLFFLFTTVGFAQQDVPEHYPSDIPRPIGARFVQHLTTAEGTVFIFDSPMSQRENYELFKYDMERYKFVMDENGESLMTDKGGMVKWKKDTKEVKLVLGTNEETRNTSIVITYK